MGSKKNSSKKNKDIIHTNTDTNEGSHGGKKVNTDSRFASVHLDPRFAKLPKHKGKVTIDPRFDRMFTDPNFSSSTAHIDKRGKAKKDSSRDALKHYYRLEEEEEEQKEKLKRKEDVESEEEAGSDEDSDEREVELEKPGMDLSDFEMGTDSEASETDEKEESNDESSEDTEEEDENGLASAEEDTFVQEENVPEIDKETHRLAVVNLDWGRVKAVDLYVLLSSFVPKGGQMLSVAVYPSEFGLQRMEEEAVHGPVGLFDDEKDKKGSDDDDDDEIDNEKLRAYERSRLRYYYAVVECDSIATADHLYKNCDGVEFERSSNKLDLRFIPDSMEFKHPPRDVAKEAPADYEGLDFQTRALQLSKIDLTWDEDEPQRTGSLKRKFNAEQLADLVMKEFLASDESETDDDENNETEDRSEKKHKKKDMYRALLQSGEGSDEGDEDGDQDMEVTFDTGLENLSKRIVEKKDTESETVWEQHLRKMREKKKERKNRAKNSSEDESDDEPAEEMDDFFIDESSAKKDKRGKKKKKKKKKKKNNDEDKEAEEKSKAELELLLADGKGADAGVKGYNMKRKKVKGKKGKEIPDEGKIPTIDYEDPRFSSLFKSPLYALDPTDPQFKRSAAYARQLTQKQRVDGEEEPSGHENIAARPAQLEPDDMAMSKKERKDKHELSSLVKSIKMKSKEVKLSAGDKVSRKAAKSKK